MAELAGNIKKGDDESLFLIDKVGELNAQYAEMTQDEFQSPFEYMTDGFAEVVRFVGVKVYNTENDDPCSGCSDRPCPEACDKKRTAIMHIIVGNYQRVLRAHAVWHALSK